MGIAGIHAIYGGNICSVYYTTPQAILKHKLDQIHYIEVSLGGVSCIAGHN